MTRSAARPIPTTEGVNGTPEFDGRVTTNVKVVLVLFPNASVAVTFTTNVPVAFGAQLKERDEVPGQPGGSPVYLTEIVPEPPETTVSNVTDLPSEILVDEAENCMEGKVLIVKETTPWAVFPNASVTEIVTTNVPVWVGTQDSMLALIVEQPSGSPEYVQT